MDKERQETLNEGIIMNKTKKILILVVVTLIILSCSTIANAGIINTSIETVIEKKLLERNNELLNPANVRYIEDKINTTISTVFKNIPIKLQMKLLYFTEVFVISFLTIGNEKTIIGKMINLLERIKNIGDKLISLNEKESIELKAKHYLSKLTFRNEYEHDALLLIVTILYEFIALLMGHNNLTEVIVTMLTIWFVVPCCFIIDFIATFSGGIFNFDAIITLLDDLFITGGILGLLLFPLFIIINLPSFFNGNSSDLIERVKQSVSYIYASVFNRG